MFCPKCGTKNPDNGKFCRGCGSNLGNVSEALATGNAPKPVLITDRRGKPVHWESAIVKLFSGIAFLIVSIALAFSVMGTGWWFWMLIPAFSAIGAGLAQMMQLRRHEKQNALIAPEATQNTLSENKNAASLSSPIQTGYVAPDSRYKTGDLVPPSVTDGTTRNLEINKEGETMALPKK